MMTERDIPFARRLSGRFEGMVRLADVERLQETVATLDGWYLLQPGEEFPETPVEGETAHRHLHSLVEEICREEGGGWSTMVYVQSLEDPWIIKVFHPRRAGCGCGPGGNVRPWWVLSRIEPEMVPEWQRESCNSAPPGWWRKLL